MAWAISIQPRNRLPVFGLRLQVVSENLTESALQDRFRDSIGLKVRFEDGGTVDQKPPRTQLSQAATVAHFDGRRLRVCPPPSVRCLTRK